MAKKYIVRLEAEEREKLLALISSGTSKARTLTHARVLVKADEGWQDEKICQALDVSIPTVERVRKRFVFEGFDVFLKSRRPNRIYSRKLDGEQEARVIALVCSLPPEGYARWSLRLLADRVVQLKIIDSISHETIRQMLEDNELKPWRKQEWCIPTQADAEFVYHMEDILDVYKRPADPKRPLVCFDESPKQLVSETRQALPMQPGQPEKYDYEYQREGVAKMFMFFAPLQNWRGVKVTDADGFRFQAQVAGHVLYRPERFRFGNGGQGRLLLNFIDTWYVYRHKLDLAFLNQCDKFCFVDG